jgi:hypothetical protein
MSHDILSSHGGKYEAQNLLGCTAMFLIECDRRFRGKCCLHHQGDE